MTSMTPATGPVTGGVDTHGQTHHAAVLDQVGRQLGDREFPTTPAGYRALGAWLSRHGQLERVGVEGTGTYGAGLARHLRGTGVAVVEVDRPDRKARRAKGKSDPLDAYAAARAALSGTASGCPKTRDGRVETIRALRVARSGAVKARSQATNQPGDRAANNALYIVVLGRLRYDARTRAYADRRTKQGLSKPEIIRCLKRYVARQMFTALTARVAESPPATTSTQSTAA